MADPAPADVVPAEATPGVDPNSAGAGGDEKGKFPPPDEQLEKWMMNTVREGDAAAKVLRNMLQMNPAYGTYLSTDEDLINVVQMFSKRIKTKIAQYETPAHVPPQALNQPLCEMVWRVVGYVMHGVIDLEEEANMPVPKEASGMIKMLLHTNTQLSVKLNELRRSYLRELASHRDKQRILSKTAERAIENLKEQPIMFYEPLEYVLDETTKEFVREAVVERIKLEMRSSVMNSEDNSEMTNFIEELEGKLELARAEAKTSKATSTRLEEQMKTLGAREAKLKEDLAAQKETNEEQSKRLAELEALTKKQQSDINAKTRRVDHLEKQLAELGSKVETAPVVDNSEALQDMEELSGKNIELEATIKKQAAIIEALQRELAGIKASGSGETVYQEDPETKRLLDQALKVEHELKEANKALEKALADAENENADMKLELEALQDKLDEMKKSKGKSGGGPSTEEIDEIKQKAIDKAMKKMKKEHDDKVNEMQSRIDKLTSKLEKAEARIKELEDEATTGEPKAKKEKVVKQVGVPEEEHNKLKTHCSELEKRLEELEDAYAKLEQKTQMLMEKLKEKFSDAELADIVKKIDLAPPPIRKKRKKKAYERLYDDAQRRITEMHLRQEKLKQLEEKSLRNMQRIASSTRDRSKVEMLTHLHNANQQTSARFHEALVNFQQGRGADPGLLEDFDEDDEDRMGTMSDLDMLTLQCFKDGVCPRCAFSALTTMRRTPSRDAHSRPGVDAFGTSWSSAGAGLPRRPPDRSTSPAPWELQLDGSRSGSIHSRGASPLGRGHSPPTDPRRAFSPIVTGPAPGAMPFDAAFPLPSPPWRQPGAAAETLPPWRQEPTTSAGRDPFSATLPASMSSTGPPVAQASTPQPSMSSTGPPVARGATLPSSMSSTGPPVARGALSSTGPPVPGGVVGAVDSQGSTNAAAAADGVDKAATLSFRDDINSIPPWRRPRSTSPAGKPRSSSPAVQQRPSELGQVSPMAQTLRANTLGALGENDAEPSTGTPLAARSFLESVAQPPSGTPLSRSATQPNMPPSGSPTYGRLGRAPGQDWLPPPVPGRVPAAQSVALDPIVRSVDPGRAPPGKAASSSRSRSPDAVKSRSDGFTKMRTTAPDTGRQFESDLARSGTFPNVGRPAARSMDDIHYERPGAHVVTFGGGGHGTSYKNISSRTLPTVPLSRSQPMLPVDTPVRAPWETREVPWEPSASAKKMAPKAHKKPGPGFMVAPIMSQERMTANLPP